MIKFTYKIFSIEKRKTEQGTLQLDSGRSAEKKKNKYFKEAIQCQRLVNWEKSKGKNMQGKHQWESMT